jgi:hypothetical protein
VLNIVHTKEKIQNITLLKKTLSMQKWWGKAAGPMLSDSVPNTEILDPVDP